VEDCNSKVEKEIRDIGSPVTKANIDRVNAHIRDTIRPEIIGALNVDLSPPVTVPTTPNVPQCLKAAAARRVRMRATRAHYLQMWNGIHEKIMLVVNVLQNDHSEWRLGRFTDLATKLKGRVHSSWKKSDIFTSTDRFINDLSHDSTEPQVAMSSMLLGLHDILSSIDLSVTAAECTKESSRIVTKRRTLEASVQRLDAAKRALHTLGKEPIGSD